MKRIISVFVILAISICCISVSAAADKVEISFRVGDSTLYINGNEVTVEKPYVTDGVTLVPLRVITEAFGAEVEWIGESKTIKLSYPDVKISLVIGSNIAEINGRAETLLHSPELLPPGVTMVPLRFISETFGAEVSYDEETKAIKVIKEKQASSSIIEGAIENSKIGDSFYKWTMNNPESYKMAYRDFAGMFTAFEYDDDNSVTILIETIADDYDQDKAFNNYKSEFKGTTLVKAEKTSENNIKKIYFQIRNKNKFGVLITFATDKYIYEISGSSDYTNKEMTDELISIAESFEPSWSGNDIYDLSDVKNGYRLFKSEETNVSFKVPAGYYMADEDSANEFRFFTMDRKDSISEMGMDIYSSGIAGSALELAEKDKSNNAKAYNEKLTTVTQVSPAKYNGIDVYEYEITVSGSNKRDFYVKDIFFEKGDYVYNFHITLKDTSRDEKKIAEEIAETLSVKEINSAEIGTLIRNEKDVEETYISESGKWSVELPYLFEENYSSSDSGMFVAGDIILSINTTKMANVDYQTLRRTLKESESRIKDEKTTHMTQLTKNIQINDKSYAFMEYKKDEEDFSVYMQTYLATTKDGYVTIVAYIPEIYYSYFKLEMINNIIKSFKML